MNEEVHTIDPKHAILLVMDYMNGIIKQLPGAEAIVNSAAGVINEARKAGLNIGYVRTGFTDDDYEAVPDANKIFSVVAHNHLLPHESQDAQIHDLVAPQADDISVRKTRTGAFSTTDLEEQLQEKGIHTLILAGFTTSGVVLSMVREAADRDYKMYVLEDLSTDPDKEVHDMLMQRVFPRQTDVMKQADLLDVLKTYE